MSSDLTFITNEGGQTLVMKGDIIPNPNAKNQLNESEIKELKGIIFR